MTPAAQVPLHVEYTFECSVCGVTQKYDYQVARGNYLPAPNPPFAWVLVENQIYCPKHNVGIVVDGEERRIVTNHKD